MNKKLFSSQFLLALYPYKIKLARQLVRECREDIELFGLEFAQQKWKIFAGISPPDDPSTDKKEKPLRERY